MSGRTNSNVWSTFYSTCLVRALLCLEGALCTAHKYYAQTLMNHYTHLTLDPKNQVNTARMHSIHQALTSTKVKKLVFRKGEMLPSSILENHTDIPLMRLGMFSKWIYIEFF